MTLKVWTPEWLLCNDEYHDTIAREAHRREKERLEVLGFTSTIHEILPDEGNGRIALEVTREIQEVEEVQKYWEFRYFGEDELGPSRIGIVFENAFLFHPYHGVFSGSGVATERDPDGQWRWGWNYDTDPQDKIVAIFVDGGRETGKENLKRFLAVAQKVHAQIRIERKMRQLRMAKESGNDGQFNRLYQEVIEEVSRI